ncbi:MAG: pallilysin-related adhesin, partial [Treponema sp.]|nr:pallilysin-related adhesin [Treponema sp.]
MAGIFLKVTGIAAVTAIALGAGLAITQPRERFLPKKNREWQPSRLVVPRSPDTEGSETGLSAEQLAFEDSLNTKAALAEGELMVSILNQDFDGDGVEEQIIAYRNLLESESPVHLAYTDYHEAEGIYKRIWDSPTAATRPGTVSLYTQDLIGDRSLCVILTGMNSRGEYTLTAFRGIPSKDAQPVFRKIVDLGIEGTIAVKESERPLAYQQGLARGRSFPIVTYGHNRESENILDQIETTYTYNPDRDIYEQSQITHIPGSQIEQLRLRELLSGKAGVFEEFISDLWYYVSPQGTLDSRQYIYFDPSSREIIFFGDEAQQVFTWQNSAPTRYGLYITSQNVSITTLRRIMDIELESLDSIRIKVFEDVRLNIRVNNSWDGSYRRAKTMETRADKDTAPVTPYIDAVYDSALGRIRFFRDGSYEISSAGTLKKGRYAFFAVDGREVLELRAETR